jgi:hypothetical protein
MAEFTDPAYLEEENERIATMVTAMYVKTLYPDLSITEIFGKLRDVEFLKKVIKKLLEEGNED